MSTSGPDHTNQNIRHIVEQAVEQTHLGIDAKSPKKTAQDLHHAAEHIVDQALQKMTPEQIQQVQTNKNMFVSFVLGQMLAKEQIVLLEQVQKDYEIQAASTTAFAKATVTSGKDTEEAANIQMNATMASGAAAVMGTAGTMHAGMRTTDKMKDLQQRHENLSKTLDDGAAKMKIGDDTGDDKVNVTETKAELSKVDKQLEDAHSKQRAASMLATSLGSTMGDYTKSIGNALAAGYQMAASVQQADASIYKELAQQMPGMIQQAITIMKQFQEVDPYAAQQAMARG